MSKGKFNVVLVLLSLALSACGNQGAGVASSGAAGTCSLVSTKDNSPLAIKAVGTDTPEAKEFLATCVNPLHQKIRRRC